MKSIIISAIIIAHGYSINDNITARGQEWVYTDAPQGDCIVVFDDNGTPDVIEDDIIKSITAFKESEAV